MVEKNAGRQKILRVLFWVTVLVIIALIMNFGFRSDTPKINVGCVMIGKSSDRGWSESHYEGLREACGSLGCVLHVQESVPEEPEALYQAVVKLVGEDCQLIFFSSHGYGEYAGEVARQFPNVAFYSVDAIGEEKNLTSYFARLYQVRYLAGIVAGSMSRSKVLGFVAPMQIPQVNQDINAYTLGARRANPRAKVLVRWTGSWDDEKAERTAVQELLEKGADVITGHQSHLYVDEAAQKAGAYSIGYNPVNGEVGEKMLTSVVYNWDTIYQNAIGDYLGGRTNLSEEYWPGLQEHAVQLAPYSPLVRGKAKRLVEKEKKRILTYRDVFSGTIYDNQGKLRCEEDERISDQELFTKMNWFVEGVEANES